MCEAVSVEKGARSLPLPASVVCLHEAAATTPRHNALGVSDLRSLVALPPASDIYDRGVVSRCHCYHRDPKLLNLKL